MMYYLLRLKKRASLPKTAIACQQHLIAREDVVWKWLMKYHLIDQGILFNKAYWIGSLVHEREKCHCTTICQSQPIGSEGRQPVTLPNYLMLTTNLAMVDFGSWQPHNSQASVQFIRIFILIKVIGRSGEPQLIFIMSMQDVLRYLTRK
jgi:hypothetical protein